METYDLNYYTQKIFALLFGVAFTSFSVFSIISPESITTTINGEIVETTFLTSLPGLILGLLFISIFIWMTRNYFSVKMDEEGVFVKNSTKLNMIKWSQIESIREVKWLWRGTIFRVKPKNTKAFYFHSDKPKMNTKTIFGSGFDTEMADFVKMKKQELDI